jgi:prophage regulatory protein
MTQPTTEKPILAVSDIADLLGVSRQRAGQLTQTKGFPEPWTELRQGPVWKRKPVERWMAKTGRG